MRPTPTRSRQAGYSLVETLIAMALLGTVLMSIITLFYFGRTNVYSGKQMTQAVAVTTRITEDLADLSHSDVVSRFGLASKTLGNNTVAGKTYANSAIVRTGMASPPAYITNWAALMGSDRFLNGRITLIFTPVDPEAAGAPTIATAPILRIRGVVEWQEGRRARNVTIDTTKVDRAL